MRYGKMKIAYVCPGTGGAFYCENCVRDHALVSGLRALGHDVDVVPMYLPIKEYETPGSNVPVMFGAVRLYLIDKFPFLKRMSQKSLRFLDHRSILNMAAGFAGSTRAGGHEEMTISMIEGEEGPFADEFDRTTGYLLALKPDLIILSNAFLLGIASSIKTKSNVRIICMLQDEHIWVDASDANYRDRIWETIAKKSLSVDRFYTHSGWFRNKIAGLLGISPDTVSVIPFGVDPTKYVNPPALTSPLASMSPSSVLMPTPASPSTPTQISIGYISRLCSDLGMGVLSEAYCRLLRNGVCDEASTLEFCGGYTKDDAATINSSRKKIIKTGGRANIHKHFGIDDRATLLSSLTALSVPAQTSIALGGFIIEAMAAGVPVVQPDDGGFSEIVSETGAGLLYSPNTPEALAEALEKVIRDEDSRKSMAAAGRRAVLDKYNNVEMARQAVAFCD